MVPKFTWLLGFHKKIQSAKWFRIHHRESSEVTKWNKESVIFPFYVSHYCLNIFLLSRRPSRFSPLKRDSLLTYPIVVDNGQVFRDFLCNGIDSTFRKALLGVKLAQLRFIASQKYVVPQDASTLKRSALVLLVDRFRSVIK